MRISLIAASAVALSLGTFGAAQASQDDCVCMVPSGQTSQIGVATAVKGSVFIKGKSGFEVLGKQMPVSASANIVSGNNANVTISFVGGCKASLSGNSSLVFTKKADGATCVRNAGLFDGSETTYGQTAPVTTTTGLGNAGLIAAGVGAAAIVGIAAVALSDDDDDPVAGAGDSTVSN